MTSKERILLRAGKDPRHVVGPEATLGFSAYALFGSNVGNALFSDAVWRMLSVPSADVSADGFAPERVGDINRWAGVINEQFDRYVLPLANAIRPARNGWWLDRIASLVEKLTVPVTIVGVGAQAEPDGTPHFSDEVDRAACRLVRAVLERSARVGVRGDNTAAYLRKAGFGEEHVQVIGCPSVYLRGPDYEVTPVADHLEANSPIGLSVAPPEAFFGPVVAHHASAYPNLIYVPQEAADLALLLWGENRPGSFAPGMPATTDHDLYVSDRTRFPLDTSTWLDLVRPLHMVFGSRIHGVIAALVAGVPGLTIAFSPRIDELARYHEIPCLRKEEIPEGFDVARAYETLTWDLFNAGLRPRFDVFTGFLESNGLAHIYQAGQANPEFDQLIAQTEYPPAVRALTPASPTFAEDVRSRLTWLRQGAAGDAGRSVGAYALVPVLEQVRPDDSVADRLAALEGEVARLRSERETPTRARTAGWRRLATGVRRRARRLLPGVQRADPGA